MTALFPHAHRPPTFVLDVSVAAAWVLPSLANSYADRVLARMVGDAAAVPSGYPADIAQVWLDGEARGEVSSAVVDLRLTQQRNFSLHLDDGREPHVWADTVPLARRLGLPVARAAYLELAVRLNLPLATTAPVLVAAAAAAGVARLVP